MKIEIKKRIRELSLETGSVFCVYKISVYRVWE